MTRINSAIPVQRLTDEHLLAEHREIKRLPYFLDKAINSGSIKRIPEKFTLGKGHVKFFLDKQGFVFNRYQEIYDNLKKRGFNPTNYKDNWNNVDCEQYCAIHKPTEEEHSLLVERITTRLLESNKKFWHYYSKPISKQEALELLQNKIGT